MTDTDPVGVVLAEVRDMGPASAHEIALGVGLPETSVRRYLRRLEDTGLVESDRYGQRARVYMEATR